MGRRLPHRRAAPRRGARDRRSERVPVRRTADRCRARFADVEGRRIYVIAESAANDARLITAKADGGIGCDAQWDDDFHHALHAVLTGEHDGYYADFGAVSDLAVSYREAFVYAHRYSVFRDLHHGRSAAGLPGERFVVFDQNHDQVGNRARGDRIASLVGVDGARVAAAAVLLSPFVPLLFMGEEYGETNPFPYFVSHSVTRSSSKRFAGAGAEEFGLDPEHALDPQAEATFLSAKLDWAKRGREPNAALLRWYRSLLELRSERPALAQLDPSLVATDVFEEQRVDRRAARRPTTRSPWCSASTTNRTKSS